METTTMRIHGCLLNLKDYKEAETIAYPPGDVRIHQRKITISGWERLGKLFCRTKTTP